jgi:hypothetical protein
MVSALRRPRTHGVPPTEPSVRLCENPVFGGYRLYKLLILLDRIFKKSTFHTVWRCSGRHTASAVCPRSASKVPRCSVDAHLIHQAKA